MTERWVKMVERQMAQRCDDSLAISKDEAVGLLARQHRAFVRMVKKEMANIPFDIPRDDAEQLASQQHLAVCRRILASLATHPRATRKGVGR